MSRPKFKTVSDLIDTATPAKIVERINALRIERHKAMSKSRRGRRATGKPKLITVEAVYKWRLRGIPDEHWGVLMELTGVPLDKIYAINEEMRLKAA